MDIGILYCGYNQIDNVSNTLSFWNDIKIEGINFIVCVVSVPFLEYREIQFQEDGTVNYIKSIQKNNIKNCIFEPKFVKERVARNHAMDFLTNYDIEYLWQVDSDEYYTRENVINIINYIKASNNFCFSVNFKNYIFDENHYLDDFCPTKINKVSGQKLLTFFDDNQIVYQSFGLVRPTPIPKQVAFIKHLTWLHKNGKQKIEYQLKHFGDCSYRWNEQEQKLEIDLDYYKRHGFTVPNILKE